MYVSRWQFASDGADIGFGVYRRTKQGASQKVADMQQVLPCERYNAHLVPEDSCLTCPEPGVCKSPHKCSRKATGANCWKWLRMINIQGYTTYSGSDKRKSVKWSKTFKCRQVLIYYWEIDKTLTSNIYILILMYFCVLWMWQCNQEIFSSACSSRSLYGFIWFSPKNEKVILLLYHNLLDYSTNLSQASCCSLWPVSFSRRAVLR